MPPWHEAEVAPKICGVLNNKLAVFSGENGCFFDPGTNEWEYFKVDPPEEGDFGQPDRVVDAFVSFEDSFFHSIVQCNEPNEQTTFTWKSIPKPDGFRSTTFARMSYHNIPFHILSNISNINGAWVKERKWPEVWSY